jgi:multidrug efflux pump subunit AcrA (membrane-fusion protein)
MGSRWIVTDGLKPGDRVVVEGAPAAAGTIVSTTPFVAPAEGH